MKLKYAGYNQGLSEARGASVARLPCPERNSTGYGRHGWLRREWRDVYSARMQRAAYALSRLR